jgi:hypothetical protein
VAQTGQVLDVWPRSGNVHDSNGARDFILSCINALRECMPDVTIEVRMDSAIISEYIISTLNAAKVD